MKIEIKKFNPEKIDANEIKSAKIFKPRRIRSANTGNFRFHEEGIFSREIFGEIRRCLCGQNKKIGTKCENCGSRVVSTEEMPNFYISVGIKVPYYSTSYSKFGKYSSDIEKILKYNAFLYDGEFKEYKPKETSLSDYSELGKIKIGFEAAEEIILKERKIEYERLEKKIKNEKDKEKKFKMQQELKKLEESKVRNKFKKWYDKNTIDKIPVSHPIYRQITETRNGKYILGKLNQTLINLLDSKENAKSFEEFAKTNKLTEMIVSKYILEQYEYLMQAIFEDQFANKNSIIKNESIGQSITGAIRAVIINNYDRDEDEIFIGTEFIETLFPDLFRDCDNFKEINEKLIKGDYRVLVNRPPTIGEKSILAMKPRVDLEEDAQFVISTNPIIFDGLAADTDGDVFLVVAIYSEEARDEIDALLPSRNYIGGSNGKVRNGLPEDFLYTMKRVYEEKDEESLNLKSEIKNLIWQEDNKKTYEEDLEEMNEIPRDKYISIYKIIGKNMWSYCKAPTIGDIVDGFKGKENKTYDNITENLGNQESLKELLLKENSKYSNDESKKFIDSVIKSNVTDISEAGWFYKKLMSSTDDIRIISDSCESQGTEYSTDCITKEEYNYKIRFSFVKEIEDYAKDKYEDFIKKIKEKGFDFVHVKSPLKCTAGIELDSKNPKKLIGHRGLCKECAGTIKRSEKDYFIPKNFGLFSTLMITEHATQASLDTMNKGSSENINKILDGRSKNKKKVMNWQEVEEEIESVVNEIGDVGVQGRFYEVAMLSRFYEKKKGFYSISSLQWSFTNQKDPLGNFIYTSNSKNLLKLLDSGEFESNSIKTQIMFDMYEED